MGEVSHGKNFLKKSTISIICSNEKSITFRIRTYLPFKKYPPKEYPENKRYVTVYIGLPEEALTALKKYSRRTHRLQSKIIQEAMEYYLLMWEVRRPPFEPLRKKQIIGLKRIARTIKVDQDKRLRFLAEKTVRSISELSREAIIGFLKMRQMFK